MTINTSNSKSLGKRDPTTIHRARFIAHDNYTPLACCDAYDMRVTALLFSGSAVFSGRGSMLSYVCCISSKAPCTVLLQSS